MSYYSELSLCNSYMSGDGRGQNKEAYDTGYSQAVTHPSTNLAQQSLTSVIGREPVFSLWYGRRQGNQSSNTGSSDHCRQKGRLAVVLLHLQAGILGKAVGSAIAPPYLLCRSRAALWQAWAILGIASRPFG